MALYRRDDRKLYAIALALLAVLALSLPRLAARRGGTEVEIVSDGRVVRVVPLADLSQGTLIELEGGGGFNILRMDPDGLRMASADCPGGDCLRMRPVTASGGVIACLPHRLLVRLRGAERDGAAAVDAVTY